MKTRIAIGVDPGVTTGVALVSYGPDGFEVLDLAQIDSRKEGEWGASCSIAEWILDRVELPLASAIVVEDFVLRRSEMDRTLLSPIRLTMLFVSRIAHVWMMRAPYRQFVPDPRPGQPVPILSLSQSHPSPDPATTFIVPFVVQQPAQAKTTMTDARLKHYGIYAPTRGKQHARDAVRHAATYLMKEPTP